MCDLVVEELHTIQWGTDLASIPHLSPSTLEYERSMMRRKHNTDVLFAVGDFVSPIDATYGNVVGIIVGQRIEGDGSIRHTVWDDRHGHRSYRCEEISLVPSDVAGPVYQRFVDKGLLPRRD